MNFIRKHIRYKLIISFALVLVIPLIVVGYYSVNSSRKALKETALSSEMNRVQSLAGDISTFLSGVVSDLQFLANSPAVNGILAARMDNRENLSAARSIAEREFLAFSKSKRIYMQIRYLDENGNEVVRVDSDGVKHEVIARSKLQNKSGRYYFDDTIRMNEGEILVSPLDLNMERGKIEEPHKPVIRYAVPVFYQGKRSGIVILNILAKNFLRPLQKNRSSQIYLTDSDGFYLSHPVSKKCWGRQLNSDFSVEQDYPGYSSEILQAKEGSLEFEDELLVHVPIVPPGVTDDTYWVITSSQSRDTVLASVNSFQTLFIGLTIVALAIAMLVAYLLAKRITDPLNRLSFIADQISQGDIDRPILIDSEDEIKNLADSLERMRASLQVSVEMLNEKI